MWLPQNHHTKKLELLDKKSEHSRTSKFENDAPLSPISSYIFEPMKESLTKNNTFLVNILEFEENGR